MALRVWGEVMTDANMSSSEKFHPFTPDNSVIFRGCQTWILVSNNPTFTDLNMKIYSANPDGSSGKLLETSNNSIAKSTILTTEDNAYAQIHFTFTGSGDGFKMRGGTTYNFVLNATGASGWDDTNKFIVWLKGWPDPPAGQTVTFWQLATVGYAFAGITADY